MYSARVSDNYANVGLRHPKGTRLNPDTIRPCSAWIAPDGTAYYVPSCNHSATAPVIGDKFGMGDDVHSGTLERAGWVHFSLAYDTPDAAIYVERGMTQAQADTLFAMFMNMNVEDYNSESDYDAEHDTFSTFVHYAMSHIR